MSDLACLYLITLCTFWIDTSQTTDSKYSCSIEQNKLYRQGEIPSRYLFFIVMQISILSSDPTTLTDQYNTVVASTLDDYARITKKRVAIKPSYSWLNEDLRSEKNRIKFEQKWRKTGLIVHQEIFVTETTCKWPYKSLKTKYYADKTEECRTDQKALFNVNNSLHNKRKEMLLP